MQLENVTVFPIVLTGVMKPIVVSFFWKSVGKSVGKCQQGRIYAIFFLEARSQNAVLNYLEKNVTTTV